MDALLTDRWLDGSGFLSVVDDASVAVAREAVREAASERGFSAVAIGELAIVVSELATNQIRHARSGRIALRSIARDGVAGLEILAVDRGPGIEDPTEALRGEPRITGSLGTGLSSVLRMTDEVDFDVRLREGTCVAARKFVEPVRRRREVAIFGRPFEDESRSGDDALVLRDDHRLLVAVADGLGHGAAAREASSGAISVLRATGAERVARDPGAVFDESHRALEGTRGTVLSIAAIDEEASELTHAAIGNVVTHVVGVDGSRAFGGPSFVLGMRGAQVLGRARPEHHPLRARDVVILFSDGLSSRARLERGDDVLHDHPLLIAHRLVRAFGRETDDVTVAVAR